MYDAIYDNVTKVGKSSYETIKGLYAINTTTAEQLFEQQLALLTLGTEYTSRQMKLASEAKGYKEIVEGQAEIVSDISSKAQGIVRNTLDILNESKDELNSWYEKSVKETEKGFKETAKSVSTPKAA